MAIINAHWEIEGTEMRYIGPANTKGISVEEMYNYVMEAYKEVKEPSAEDHIDEMIKKLEKKFGQSL